VNFRAGHPGLQVLLLAAGGSTRLGRPKQFLRLRGASLLASRIRLAGSLDCGRPLVVSGARRFAVERAARLAGPTACIIPAGGAAWARRWHAGWHASARGGRCWS
jgi:molybdenum cofactor cytidylyltransferase